MMEEIKSEDCHLGQKSSVGNGDCLPGSLPFVPDSGSSSSSGCRGAGWDYGKNEDDRSSHDVSNHPHPLLNSLVLYNVFSYLHREDVLNSRLVCTTWDAEACRLLRKELTLDFQDICHISNFKRLLDDNGYKKPNRETPFARIYLRSTFRLGHDVAQDFFVTHGHHIKHLKIAKVGCDCGANFFQKLVYFQAKNLISLNLQIISAPIRLPPNSLQCKYKYFRMSKSIRLPLEWRLPNLKHLHMRHQLFAERPRFIDEILEACVNLEVLSTDEATPLFCLNVLVPRILAAKNDWIKLKMLLIGDMLYLSNDQMLQLAGKKIPLEFLSLSLNPLTPALPEADLRNLVILLLSFQDHVKKIELFNHRPDLQVELRSFPQLKNLESLKLTNISFPSVHLEGLQNLKTLSVVHEDTTLYNSLFNLKIPPHKALRSIGLYPISSLNLSALRDWMFYWNSNAKVYIEELSSAFPCLRILSVNGNDCVLKNIYLKMPTLEALTIHGPITDEGVTGISLETCQRMHNENDYGLIDSDELDELLFVGDLKKLRKLTISFVSNRPLLTEVSVFLGFICCTDLIDLDIGNKVLVDLWKEEVKRIRGASQNS